MNRLTIPVLFVLGLVCAAASQSPKTEANGPGLFVFGARNQHLIPASFGAGANPIIEWRALEPAEGVYDWSLLDQAILQAEALGMTIVPRILTSGSASGEAAPDWFFASAGADFYYPHKSAQSAGFRAPVAWDETYQEKFGAFLRALAERYNGNPAIEFFQVTGVGVYGEMYLGSRLPAGYSVNKHKGAIRYWTGAWAAAFPDTRLSLTVNALGHEIAEEAAEYAVSRGFYLQMNTPTGNAGTRAILARHYRQTRIVIEAENGGCRGATGPGFSGLIHEVFRYGYSVDYLMLCHESFSDTQASEAMPNVVERLRR